MYAKLVGTGHYLPRAIVTNDDLAARMDTSDEWIRQRVGIVSRRIAEDSETTSSMAIAAAQAALSHSGISPASIEFIIVCTSTGDHLMPSVASQVQRELGIHGCPAFDLSAACSGFLYGMSVVEQYIKAGAAKRVLVIGAERMSRVLDWTDRSTCVLFGDGAGAAIFEASSVPGILATCLHSEGMHKEALFIESHFSEVPPVLKMEGSRVFKFAVNALAEVALEVMAKAGVEASDLDWLIPHQANERIITATAKKLELSMDKVILTLPEHGNTSAASIPLALDVAVRSGKVRSGDLILFEAIGSGFVWGASLMRM